MISRVGGCPLLSIRASGIATLRERFVSSGTLGLRDRIFLGRCVTLLESTCPTHLSHASRLLSELQVARPSILPALRLGISGAPGVGKSTFIEVLGSQLVSRGARLAVLTVDPSSAATGGSVLGDKTRMPGLSADSRVFVRPTPSRGVFGGISLSTNDTALLCEAAGFDTILIETVGVGQSESMVDSLADLFLLLLAPGGGDEIQGLKKGVVELADLIVVNKADGENLAAARETAREYARATRAIRPKRPGAPTKVGFGTTSAL